MSQLIKNCPFCGGDGKINEEKDANYSFVKCTKCGAETGIIKSSIEYCANDRAIAAWNKRADETNTINPTVNTEKVGHWIKELLGHGDYRYRCSECNTIFGSDMIDEFNHNKFCANCGVKMKELK